jgi:tetratricopeptide (TPR) repeat protein
MPTHKVTKSRAIYNVFVDRVPKLPVLLVLVVLAMAVTAPVFQAGLRNVELARRASAASNFAESARLYEAAAGQLFWRVDLWESAGISASQAGDIADTIRLLEISRRRARLTAHGWDTLGTAYWSGGDQTSALAAWHAGLVVYPSDPKLLDNLIAAADESGDYAAEQVAVLQRLAAGGDASAHYRLGLLLLQTDPARAEREVRTAAGLDGRFASAETSLLASLRAAALETSSARRLIAIGRGLGLVQEWGLASRAFQQAIDADVRDAQAWAWLGEAYQHTGRDGGQQLDEALRLGPEDAVVHGLRSLYWRRRGAYPAALAEQQKAVEIAPDDPTLQPGLGEAYTAVGSLVDALASYQKATTLAPSDATYWRLLAAFCVDNGVQVLKIGLPAALRAVALAPQDPQALDVLGWSYLQAGYPYSAEQTLLKALQAAPDLAAAHFHLADVYLRNGDRVSALAELKAARQLDPQGTIGQAAIQALQMYFPEVQP